MACAPTSWLPPPTAADAASDTARWEAMVDAFVEAWTSSAHLPPAERALGTLPWVALFNNWVKVLDRQAVSPRAARAAVETMLAIAAACPPHTSLAVHTRWLGLAGAHMGKACRIALGRSGFTADWKGVRALVEAAGLTPLPAYEGPVVREQLRSAALRLARSARRFYPPGAAAEIWAAAEPGLRPDRTPEAAPFEALGWLALLFPAKAVASPHPADTGLAWGGMVASWLSALQSVGGNAWWDGLWLRLFARVARHDTRGACDWAAASPVLLSRVQAAVPVPVGTAAGDPPFGRPPPARVGALFGGEGGYARARCAAKLAAALAGVGPPPPPPGPAGGLGGGGPGEEGATDALLRVLCLLEQYAHPSNTGRWSPALGDLVAGLARHVAKRLTTEAVASAQAQAAGSAGAPPPPPPPPGPFTSRGPLSGRDAARLGDALARLGGVLIFSKNSSAAGAGCDALAEAAYLSPASALPLVARRFEAALASLAAAHTLGGATDALSACVRPLLALGLPPDWAAEEVDDDGGGGGRGPAPMAVEEGAGGGGADPPPYAGDPAAGAAFLSAACGALLPALDPSDPAKTVAALRLMGAALSSGVIAPEEGEEGGDGGARHPATLPPGFLDGLLDRIAALLTALDSGDAGGGGGGTPDGGSGGGASAGNGGGLGGGGGSFLLGGDSLLRPVLELAFARAPPAARERGVRAVARFVSARAMPSVAAEAALVCNAAAWADPAAAGRHLLPPLLAAVEGATSAAAASPTARLSKATESGLCWALALLAATLYRAGPAAVAVGPRLRSALASAAAVPSRPAVELAARAVGSALIGLASYYPTGLAQCGPVPLSEEEEEEEGGGGGGGDRPPPALDPFLDHVEARGARPPTWHTPSPGEVELARALVADHLTGAVADMRAALGGGDGGGRGREALRAALLRAEGVLQGARAGLADFGGAARPPDGGDPAADLGIRGSSGPGLGLGPGPREELGAALASLLLSPSAPAPASPRPSPAAVADPDTLAIAARVAGGALLRGGAEHGEAAGAHGAWAGDAEALAEPRAARWAGLVGLVPPRPHPAQLAATLTSDPKSPHRRRKPRWLVVERAYGDALWRAGQAAWRGGLWGGDGGDGGGGGCTGPTRARPGGPASPADLPPGWRALTAALLSQAGGAYAGVRGAAVGALEGVLKRAPVAAPAALPACLAALARTPPRPPGEVEALLGLGAGPPPPFADGDPAAGVPADLMAALLAAIPGGPGGGSGATTPGGGDGGGERARGGSSAEEDGAVLGAVGLLRTQALWRLACRRPAAAAATAAALAAASRAVTSPRAAAAAFDAWATHAMRFVRPPGLAAAAAAGAPLPASVAALAVALAATEDEATAASAAPQHWRPSLVRAGTALLLLPPPSAADAQAAAAAAAAALASPTAFPSRRAVAAAALGLLCPREADRGDLGWTTPAGRAAAAAGVATALTANPSSYGPGLLDGFASAHPQDGDSGGRGGGGLGAAAAARALLLGAGGGGAGGGASLDERAAELLTRSLERSFPWLRAGEPAPTGVAEGWFVQRAAAAAEALGRAAPGPAAAALSEPVAAALASAKAQDADRPRAAAAAEALAGLTASGALFCGGGDGGAWGAWAAAAWRAGLACPPPLVPAWAAALRFAVAGLAAPGSAAPDAPAALAALLDVLDSVVSVGGGGQEAANGEAGGGGAAAAARGLTLCAAAAAELGAVGAWAAPEAAPATASPAPFARPPVGPAIQAVAAGWGLKALAAARAGAAAPSDAVRGAAATLLALVAGPALAVPSSSPLASASSAAVDATVEGATAAAAWFAVHNGTAVEAGAAAPPAADAPAAAAAAAALESAASLVLAALAVRGGPSARPLSPALARLAAPLARSVDLGTAWPGADAAAGAAGRAVAALKYVAWPPAAAAGLLADCAAVAGAGGDSSTTMAARGAALQLAGALWFRSALALPPRAVTPLTDALVASLSDPKRPVADLAAGTLAGLVRGLPPGESDALRARLAAAAAATRPAKKQKGAAGALPPPPSPTTRTARLAAVLGLRALVSAAPYDVPPWLPAALLALAGAAGEGEPVGGAARAALSEFRRTHEAADAGRAPGGRPAGLTTEEWETVQNVGAGGTSYFV